MVQDPRAATGAGGIRLLNQPRPAAIEAAKDGTPAAIVWQGRYRNVTAIHDAWRIDDEWWRDEIMRHYFTVEVEGGRRLTVFHDLVADTWFIQTYEAPVRGKNKLKRA
jgi:hypothetical protein